MLPASIILHGFSVCALEFAVIIIDEGMKIEESFESKLYFDFILGQIIHFHHWQSWFLRIRLIIDYIIFHVIKNKFLSKKKIGVSQKSRHKSHNPNNLSYSSSVGLSLIYRLSLSLPSWSVAVDDILGFGTVVVFNCKREKYYIQHSRTMWTKIVRLNFNAKQIFLNEKVNERIYLVVIQGHQEVGNDAELEKKNQVNFIRNISLLMFAFV